MSVNPYCINEVLDAIVGSTEPQGDTYLDEKAQANIGAFREVCEWVAKRLCQANAFYDSPFGSAQTTARMVMWASGDLSLLWDVESGRCSWLKEVD